MKKTFYTLIALCLVLVTVFTGCEEQKPTQPPSSITPATSWHKTYEDICFITTVDPGPYEYGKEINVNLAIQMSERFKNLKGIQKELLERGENIAIEIVETSAFEVVGESKATFDILIPDYICGNMEGNWMYANFKIKINDPSYLVQSIKIEYRFFNKELEMYEDPICITEIMFIADSQGIMLHYIPYCKNHYECYNHPYSVDYDKQYSPRDIINQKRDAFLAKSFDREYLAGVPVEELIDRYIEYKLKDDIHLYMYRDETGDCRISYISKDVRFQVYMSDDNEWVEKFDYFYKDVPKNFLKFFLPYAKEAGIISESEFEIEKARMEDYRTKVVKLELPITPEVTAFSIPTGDDFYNNVVDLRK